MTSLPQIQNRLREDFIDLCEACYFEHAWLEEGELFEPHSSKHAPAAHSEAAGTPVDETESK